MHEPSSHSFMSARLQLHYVRWGDQGLEPLLLLHGGLDHCRTWDWFANELKGRYQLIALDLRGHGDSDWAVGNTYSMIDFVYDVIELLDHLKMPKISIVGHSLGGAIALKYAGLFPENIKQLVAIESLGYSPEKLAQYEAKSVDQHAASWLRQMRRLQTQATTRRVFTTQEKAVQRMRLVHPNLTAGQAKHLTIHGVRQNEDGGFGWKADPYVKAYQPFDMDIEETHYLWARISCPVLLIYGEDSWASNPAVDGRDRYFKDVQVECIPGAGHAVHHDQLSRFTEVVEDFLKN